MRFACVRRTLCARNEKRVWCCRVTDIQEKRCMSNEPGKPDFSNVQSGGSTVSAPAPKKPDFSNVESGGSTVSASPQTYTVVNGDSLSQIPKNLSGDAN